MAQKAIREADGKRMMARLFKEYSGGKFDIKDKVVALNFDFARILNLEEDTVYMSSINFADTTLPLIPDKSTDIIGVCAVLQIRKFFMPKLLSARVLCSRLSLNTPLSSSIVISIFNCP